MHLWLFLLLLSVLIQSVLIRKRDRNLFVPFSFFTILHFLHNWSFSLCEYLFPQSSVIDRVRNHFVLIYVSDESLTLTLIISLAAQWCFFCILFAFGKRTQEKFSLHPAVMKTNSGLLSVYWSSAAVSFLLGLANKAEVYGMDQAMEAGKASNPVATVLFLIRICCSLLICLSLLTQKKYSHIVKYLLVELIFCLFFGGRKNIIIVFIPLIVYYFSCVEIKRKFRFVALSVLLLFSVIFVNEFITSSRGKLSNFTEQLHNTLQNMASDETFIHFLCSSNSQMVQGWCFDYMRYYDLKPTYGLGYVEAFVNIFVPKKFHGSLLQYQSAYYFKKAAYPNVTNMGWDFSFSADAYLNFCYLFLIPFIILSFFIVACYNKKATSSFAFCLYYGIWGILFVSFRTDSVSLFRYISFLILILFLLRLMKMPFGIESKTVSENSDMIKG